MKDAPERKQFRLTKFRLRENKGVEAWWEQEIGDGGTTTFEENHRKRSIVRHADLDEAADKLKEHILNVFEISASMESKITILGATLSGKDEKAQILITAKMDVIDGRPVALNTPNILFTDPSYDKSNDLKKIAKELENEIFAYFFKEKLGQATLGFGKEKPKKKTKMDADQEEALAEEGMRAVK